MDSERDAETGAGFEEHPRGSSGGDDLLYDVSCYFKQQLLSQGRLVAPSSSSPLFSTLRRAGSFCSWCVSTAHLQLRRSSEGGSFRQSRAELLCGDGAWCLGNNRGGVTATRLEMGTNNERGQRAAQDRLAARLSLVQRLQFGIISG